MVFGSSGRYPMVARLSHASLCRLYGWLCARHRDQELRQALWRELCLRAWEETQGGS